MYSYIKGELAEINTDHIVIDVNGIGYLIYISSQALDYLPAIGETIKVHTYLYSDLRPAQHLHRRQEGKPHTRLGCFDCGLL